MKCLKGIQAYSKKLAGSVAQLKCLYTNACSMGSKQKEVEALVHLESYDIIAVAEAWWDESHDWSAGINGSKLLRRDRQGRRGVGIVLYVFKERLIAQSCD